MVERDAAIAFLHGLRRGKPPGTSGDHCSIGVCSIVACSPVACDVLADMGDLLLKATFGDEIFARLVFRLREGIDLFSSDCDGLRHLAA